MSATPAASLLDLPHAGRTRVRVSVNAEEVANRFEGGTARLPRRIPGWRDAYGSLLCDVANAVADVPEVDLTVECITHRFTEGSKDVLLGWYPRTKLEMDEASRTRKFNKYGAAKYVYPKTTMTELRSWFETALTETLPMARTLYWT